MSCHVSGREGIMVLWVGMACVLAIWQEHPPIEDNQGHDNQLA